MDSNLNDILARINMKLNHFTQENNPTRDFNIQSAFNYVPSNSKSHMKHHLNHDRQIISEEQIKKQSEYQQKFMLKGRLAKYILNEEQYVGNHQENKNKNQSYQQFRASRSHEKPQKTEMSSKIPKSSMQYHQQTLIGLKQRNNALQSDVKNLKDRLKLLQSSLEKDNKQKYSKQKKLIKVKSSNNELIRQSARNANYNSCKQIRKIPTYNKSANLISHTQFSQSNYKANKTNTQQKDNFYSQKPMSSNIHRYQKLHKKANNTFNEQHSKNNMSNKRIQIKSSQSPSFQTSLHHIVSANKTPKYSKTSMNIRGQNSHRKNIEKQSIQDKKTLHRCKSYHTLNIIEVRQDEIKQGKCRQKSGQDESVISSHSYLRPVDSSGYGNSRIFSKANNKQSKLKKTVIKKYENGI